MATFLRLSSCSSSAIVDMEKVVSISSGDLLYRELLRPNWSSFPDPDNLKIEKWSSIHSLLMRNKGHCFTFGVGFWGQSNCQCWDWGFDAADQPGRPGFVEHSRKQFDSYGDENFHVPRRLLFVLVVEQWALEYFPRLDHDQYRPRDHPGPDFCCSAGRDWYWFEWHAIWKKRHIKSFCKIYWFLTSVPVIDGIGREWHMRSMTRI